MIVLGVAGGFGHEASACLVRDGRVVAMVEEERLIRSRHARGAVPIHAALYCLAEAGVTPDDVDCLAVSWDPGHPNAPNVLASSLQRFLRHEAWRPYRPFRVEFVDHHLAHAACAWLCSGFDEAAVLVVDGNGEHAVTSIGRATGGKIALDRSFGPKDSLGHLYKTASEWAGLGHDGEGRLMGLAPYGAAGERLRPVVLEPGGYRIDLPPTEGFEALRAGWLAWFEANLGPANTARWSWDPTTGGSRREIALPPHVVAGARAVQATLVDTMVHLAGVAVQHASSRRLVLAGGVALNCAANGAIARSGLVEQLFVPPAANDAGGALGAALLLAHRAGDRIEPPGPYLGPSFEPGAIRRSLETAGCAPSEPADLVAAVADLVAAGACVGWFQGRAEVGPRALGARSLVARPDEVAVRDRVNRIKHREAWRPLSPSVLATAEPLYDGPPSPYMLMACPVREEARPSLVGVVHVDGSLRPQTVEPETRWGRLIAAVGERIGVPAVLNTSFNVAGEPVVSSPLDAVRTWRHSEIDALALGPFLVSK